MQLETQRLILREYTMDDFDALYEIMSDPETMQHYPAPFDQARTRRWIEWNLENYQKYGWGLWAVVLKETGEFIGDCGITLQNIDSQLLPEIGYHIHKKYWRRSFAKEAARAVRDWVFENTDYDTIYSYMKYTNVASYSTALANGMKKVKEYPDPKNEISYAYAITRKEWEELKNQHHLNFLFDLDQTLLNFHASEYIALKIIVTQNGFDFSDQLYEYFKTRNKELWLELEKEKITRSQLFETRFKLLFEKCGADTSKLDLLKINSDFIKEMARNGVLMDGALDFVKKINSQIANARIYIITNGAVVNAQGRLESTGLNQYIKETFVSEAMAYSKPAKEYFDIVLNKIAEPKENCIVIGDSLSSDMLGAKNAGLTSCWFMPQGEIEKSMKEYDVDYKADNFEELFEVLKAWAKLKESEL